MTAPTQEIAGWYRSTPIRRPVEREVPVPETKTVSTVKNLFSGLFRTKMAERELNAIHENLVKLEKILSRENYAAVQAGYFQLAVEAALRIKRPDLLAEFEKERDRYILLARERHLMRRDEK